MEFAPGVAAGQGHAGHDLLTDAGEQIAAGVGSLGEQELVILQVFIATDQIHQIGQLSGPILESCLGHGDIADSGHDAAHLGRGGSVAGIHSLTQGSVQAHTIGQLGDVLLHVNALPQTGQALAVSQILSKRSKGCDFVLQCRKVCCKSRIVKTVINPVQVPYFVHIVISSFRVGILLSYTILIASSMNKD